MNYSLCTISFRHELVSFMELIQFAHRTGFSGIELWGVHARALCAAQRFNIQASVDRLMELDMEVSMISDYLDIMVDESSYMNTIQKCYELIEWARCLKCTKIRIFAGNKSSSETSADEWEICVLRLRQLTRLVSENGMQLVIETHPGTLTDKLSSVLRLLGEVDDSNLRVNLDFLHLWESGTPPKEAYLALQSYTSHYHFKNITQVGFLNVFEPLNIYSPNGSREGIVPLGKGAIDYEEIVKLLLEDDCRSSASLEWFGSNPFTTLENEMNWLRTLEVKERVT
jgi:3-dehydroshikimate dehydratase